MTWSASTCCRFPVGSLLSANVSTAWNPLPLTWVGAENVYFESIGLSASRLALKKRQQAATVQNYILWKRYH
jgi:hypothetical protein